MNRARAAKNGYTREPTSGHIVWLSSTRILMTHELKRPLFFNVQQSKRPVIGVVTQPELAKLDSKLEASNDERSPRAAPSSLVLPLVHSPRPEKPVYIPSPSKTPQYFRWKRPPPPGHKTISNPAGPQRGPMAPSPRSSLRRDSNGNESPRRFTLTAMRSAKLAGQENGDERFNLEASQLGERATGVNRPDSPELSSWQQPSLFYYSDSLSSPPPTPKSPPSSVLFGNIVSAPKTPSKGPAEAGVNLLDSQPHPSRVARIDSLSPPVVTLAGRADATKALDADPTTGQFDQQQSASASFPFFTTSADSTPTGTGVMQYGSSEEAHERNPSPDLSDIGEDDSTFDAFAAPLVLNLAQNRPPQEKVIAQHMLRGAFMRKYLHVNNIARKLKETEQMLRSSALKAGAASQVGSSQSRRSVLLSKSPKTQESQIGDEEDDASPIDKSVPVLRRLSSIDKAINKTVKRIRRLSGTESSAEQPQSSTPQVGMKAKYTSLRAIYENQPTGKPDAKRTKATSESISASDDGDDDGGGFPGIEEVKVDPSSAHMMRICQHVMAKRAIKSFLHQEMSVIHQIEIALRDDDSMQRHRATTPAAGPSSRRGSTRGSQLGSGSGGSDPGNARDGRRPVKSMSADVVEAIAGYLEEGDQLMTVEELFVTALEAEKLKLWKRAILVTSACVVIDREFIQVVLLRARCCRRLGLWTQAVKDLGHAMQLRSDEPRLFLLRAFLFVKMADLDSALADVNRALLLHPKSTNALLLRADIFHRQTNIGASLQDLTAVLSLDPTCWRAYYDRATIRLRAVEGDEQSLSYHWEHMKYETLLVSIIEDYLNALRRGCKLVEIVETVGDLTVRLMEFTGDASVLRQVVQSLAQLIQALSTDHSGSFYSRTSLLDKPPLGGDAPLTTMERELLVAALHAQRGRLFVLFGDRVSALVEFNHAVVSEYHYPVAHFYRGAFATTTLSSALVSPAAKDDEYKINVAHLSRSIALDPTIAGAYTVRGALHLRALQFTSALYDFKAAVTTDPTLYEVWLQIALIYLNHYHDCDACIKACSSALTNDSCLARALYLRGEAYTRQGNLTAALRDYGRLTVAQPDDRWTKLLRGRLLLQLKLARPALYSFILFVEQGSVSGDKRAHVLCGLAFKILARFQRAVDEFQRAVQLNPTSENLVLLSESLHSMGDTENSLRVSEKVISADPGSFRGYVRRAQLLVSVGHLSLAVSEYDKALFLAPKEGRVYYERGIVHMQLYLRWRAAFFQLHVAGQRRLDKQSTRSPFEPPLAAIDVELALGADVVRDEPTVRRMMKTLFAGSVSDFCKCIRLEPLLAAPFVDRAELYALSEEYDKAFRDFDAALERDPKCVRAHVNLGVLKCQFAAFASAIGDFDKAGALAHSLAALSSCTDTSPRSRPSFPPVALARCRRLSTTRSLRLRTSTAACATTSSRSGQRRTGPSPRASSTAAAAVTSTPTGTARSRVASSVRTTARCTTWRKSGRARQTTTSCTARSATCCCSSGGTRTLRGRSRPTAAAAAIRSWTVATRTLTSRRSHRPRLSATLRTAATSRLRCGSTCVLHAFTRQTSTSASISPTAYASRASSHAPSRSATRSLPPNRCTTLHSRARRSCSTRCSVMQMRSRAWATRSALALRHPLASRTFSTRLPATLCTATRSNVRPS